MRFLLILNLMGALWALPAMAQNDIEVNLTYSYVSLGEKKSAQAGQIFTVGETETVLDNFSFYVDGEMGGSGVCRFMIHGDCFRWVIPPWSTQDSKFASYIGTWNASTRQVESILWSSIANGPSIAMQDERRDLERYSFNTGGLQLEAGKQYAAFLSAVEFYDNIPDDALVGSNMSNPYAGGTAIWTYIGLGNQEWFVDPSRDLAFTMNFSAPAEHSAPLPAGSVALVLAAGGVMAVRRRRV